MSLIEDYRTPKENYTPLFHTLLSYDYIINNIIRLTIFLHNNEHIPIDSTSFELINNLKSLKYLFIKSIDLVKPASINLNNLRLLYCEN
jgi:hypothetical protein